MSIEDAIRDAVRTAVRDAVREELRAALPELRLTGTGISTGGYLTVRQASEHAGVHANTIRSWLRDGTLPCCRAGRKLLIRRDEFERFLARGSEEAASQSVESRALAIMQGGRCKRG